MSVKRIIVGFLMFLAASAGVAQDQYPNRPIRVIVPYSAGSASDAAARVMAEKLTTALGQPVIGENRAGGNGAVGMRAVAASKPDGYTLAVAPGSAMSAAMALIASLPYDPVKDFAPVGLISTAPVGLVVGKDHPASTIQQFIAMAKAKPGTLTYASSGGVLELVVEAFKQKAGINLISITYKGPSEGAIDVVAGRVDMLSASVSSVAPNVQAGRMKALAVLSPTRSRALPEVPTMIEAGFNELFIVGWNGPFAPAGTPAPIVDRLNSELNKLLTLSEVKKQFDTLAFDIVRYTPMQFAEFLAEDIARLEGIRVAAGIQKK